VIVYDCDGEIIMPCISNPSTRTSTGTWSSSLVQQQQHHHRYRQHGGGIKHIGIFLLIILCCCFYSVYNLISSYSSKSGSMLRGYQHHQQQQHAIVHPMLLDNKFLAPMDRIKVSSSIHTNNDHHPSNTIIHYTNPVITTTTNPVLYYWLGGIMMAAAILSTMLLESIKSKGKSGMIVGCRAATTAPTTTSSTDVACELPKDVYAARHAVDAIQVAPGLDLATIRKISEVNKEPDWMLHFREKAFKWWKAQDDNVPEWGDVANRMPHDIRDMLQNMSMFSRPQHLPSARPGVENILNMNLNDDNNDSIKEGGGSPAHAATAAAVDAVFDSLSIATTRRKELYDKYGIIFCSLLEAARDYPDLVHKYLGSVVPVNDNYYAALNSCVFSDDNASIKYSTAQNWHAGSKVDDDDDTWSGGVLNLVTKRGQCRVTLTNNAQQADTGTKMIHIGDNTKSISSTLPVLQTSGVDSDGADDVDYGHHDGQVIEHEASTSRVSADQLQYLMSRGLQESDVLSLLLVGFCEDVFTELPLEFAEEASAMLKERLRGTVG
ncbi:hypothetical protein Pmar_PMAR016316, partial [Perkinsus marinus ATCC 50983]